MAYGYKMRKPKKRKEKKPYGGKALDSKKP